jgi:pimeloyl-ACP methyl ester carboxylesterase
MSKTSHNPIEVTVDEMVTSDGARIRYQERGSGDALILLHGWCQSGAMFHHQMAGFSNTFRVIVPDLRGHGESPQPSGGLRMARLGKDLHELMTHLQIDRAHLLGWSMGASVIWSFIDHFGTSSICKLILVDQPAMLTAWPSMPPGEIADCGALFSMQQIEDLCAGLRSSQGEEMRAGFVRGMVTKSIAPELLGWILTENAKTPLAVASEMLWSHCSQDWRDVLPRIDRPTLVICGAVSHVDKRSQYFIQRQISGAHIREFSEKEGGAHFMFLEAPAIFNDTVMRFLRNP